MNRRAFLATTAAAATAVTMKAASAETVTPFGQTGAPTLQTTAALGTATREPLSGFSSGVSQKAQGFVRAYRFPGLRRHHGG